MTYRPPNLWPDIGQVKHARVGFQFLHDDGKRYVCSLITCSIELTVIIRSEQSHFLPAAT